jgi:hypothetical protein
MENASTEEAGTPARHAMPDRLCCSAESAVSTARDTPAPRTLSVERRVTVSALAPDAPADGVAVGDAAAVADAGLLLGEAAAGDTVLDRRVVAV